jgi:hypothetical protein
MRMYSCSPVCNCCLPRARGRACLGVHTLQAAHETTASTRMEALTETDAAAASTSETSVKVGFIEPEDSSQQEYSARRPGSLSERSDPRRQAARRRPAPTDAAKRLWASVSRSMRGSRSSLGSELSENTSSQKSTGPAWVPQTGDAGQRRARWSRERGQLRSGRIAKLERALADSRALEDEPHGEGPSHVERERAETSWSRSYSEVSIEMSVKGEPSVHLGVREPSTCARTRVRGHARLQRAAVMLTRVLARRVWARCGALLVRSRALGLSDQADGHLLAAQAALLRLARGHAALVQDGARRDAHRILPPLRSRLHLRAPAPVAAAPRHEQRGPQRAAGARCPPLAAVLAEGSGGRAGLGFVAGIVGGAAAGAHLFGARARRRPRHPRAQRLCSLGRRLFRT